MIKRCVGILLIFAVLVLAPDARLSAHEGHEHKVMGTVTMAAADHVMLKDIADLSTSAARFSWSDI